MVESYQDAVSKEAWLKTLSRKRADVNTVLAILLAINLVASGVWDVYAHFFLPPGNTVSYAIWVTVREFPAAGIAIGALIGHLFWPLLLPKE